MKHQLRIILTLLTFVPLCVGQAMAQTDGTDEPAINAEECANILLASQQEDGTLVRVELNGAEILYINGDEVFIRDQYEAICLYRINVEGFALGKTVSGTLVGTKSSVEGTPRISNDNPDYSSYCQLTFNDSELPQPRVLSKVEYAQSYLCNLVTVRGVVTEESDTRLQFVTDGGSGVMNERAVINYSKYGVNPYEDDFVIYANAVVEITGIAARCLLDGGEELQICPRSWADINVILDENGGHYIDNASYPLNVKLLRTLSKDYWNTICLPLNVSPDQIAATFGQGTKLATFEGNFLDYNCIGFTDKTEEGIVSGVPYIILPARTTVNPVFSNMEVQFNEPETYTAEWMGQSYSFIGIYDPKDLIPESNENLFLGTNGNLYTPTDADHVIKGLRAYFSVPDNVIGAKIHIGGVVNSIDGIDGTTLTKAIDGNYYNLNGQRMGRDASKLAAGLYIYKGKKVVVR